MRYVFASITALSLCLLLSAPAWAGYKIALKNGQTLDAESFAIKNSMITLIYKVGEASFPISMVKAITDQDGKGDFLSGPAQQVVKPAGQQATAPAPQAAQAAPPAGQPRPVEQSAAKGAPPAAPPAQVVPQTGLPGVIGDDQRDEGVDENIEPLPPDEDLPPEEAPPDNGQPQQ